MHITVLPIDNRIELITGLQYFLKEPKNLGMSFERALGHKPEGRSLQNLMLMISSVFSVTNLNAVSSDTPITLAFDGFNDAELGAGASLMNNALNHRADINGVSANITAAQDAVAGEFAFLSDPCSSSSNSHYYQSDQT